MKRIKNPVILGVAVAIGLGGAGLLVTKYRGHAAHEAAVYYCPMHPTYTSNRPGDCPICNMKLVKKEDEVSTHPADAQPQSAKDICYMHNCPMMKPGQKCPMMVVAKPGEKVSCPVCGTHVAEAAPAQTAGAPAEKKILYWTDPMIPGYKAEGPGKSPMGMDLVPVYEEEEAPSEEAAVSPEGYAPILVSPQKRQFIGVETSPAERRSMTKTIRTVGRIAYDPELYQAQQEYIQAGRAFERAQTGTIPEVIEQAKQLLESSRMRLRLLGLSGELIDEVAKAESPDQSLLLTDPNGKAWIYAPIYEFELPLVKIGQTISVEVPGIQGKPLEGIIRSIDPVLDPASRSARVRAVLTGPEGVLKPEMFVNASIVVNLGDVLAIPEEAVFDTGVKKIAFIDKGQGLFEPRDVTVGGKADGYYEVFEGVAEGDLVVTNGNFLIDSESRLKAALKGMSGGGHQHGQ